MKEIFVNMGQIEALKGSGVLTTIGLGSCVGVAVHDPIAKVGAMAHVFLANSRPDRDPNAAPGKYADTAIPELIKRAVALGARKERLVAKLAGGAHLFPKIKGNLKIGDQNIAAVKKALQEQSITIVGEDVAGNHGRKMRFFVDTGRVEVTSIGHAPIEL